MNHLIANITWLTDYWQGKPTAEDIKNSAFGYVRSGGEPNERWNFDLTANVDNGFKVGFVQITNLPKAFDNGKGIVFFYSRNYRDSTPYIVGFYAHAEFGKFVVRDFEGNVHAPIEMCVRWASATRLPLKIPRYFNGQTTMGRANMLKIEDAQAKAILDDAIAAHADISDKQAELRRVIQSVWGETKMQRNYWKTAPGDNARYWDLCREKNCIVIGYGLDNDLREYPTQQSIKQARVAIQGEGVGAEAFIWNFVHEIKIGDVVVASRGAKQVVGVGVVASDYLPPNDKRNPHIAPNMPHARLVNWRIIQSANGDFNFGQPAIIPLKADQRAKLRHAYLEQYPNDIELKQKLEELFPLIEVDSMENQETQEQVQVLLQMTEKTRNIILYGPPGTGKTYNVQRFRDAFLAPQLRKAVPVQEQHLALVSELNWYEAIALTMILGAPKTHFRVQELLDSEPIRLMMQFKQREKNVANTLWSYLQTHTSPNVETVRFTNRRDPFLFAKSAASEWFLTDEGKAWANDNLAQTLDSWRNPSSQQIDINQFFDFITFHQSFAYEEFVEGLKPLELEDDATFVQYRVMPGVFKKICERAARDPNNNYLLIIDEINRANISKVFGELITLIEDDKRWNEAKQTGMTVHLPYSGKPFCVPDNLYILGTMNTADRSIALLDIALRRRFTFVEMMPLLEKVEEDVAGVNLRALLERVNARINALLDRDHQLGHSYLMNLNNTDDLRFAWYHRVVPLLQEYFYNDDQRLRQVLGSAFFTKRVDAAIWDGGAPEMLVTETEHYDLRRFENDDATFLDALRQIYQTGAA